MTDEHATLLFKIFLFAMVAAFYPQLLRLWRRFGYRQEHEANSVSWKRGAVIVGGVFGALVLLLLIGSIIK